ncbi:hypothetical protein TNCV_2689201, partial [Trichonephila clavipes]
YTRAFGDGPRNFEPFMVSDVDDTRAGTPNSTPQIQRETFQLSTDLTCIAALHGGSSVSTGIELVTRQATIRYLYHLGYRGHMKYSEECVMEIFS